MVPDVCSLIRPLVLVQAVDLDDPLYGFFHAWLEEASQQFPLITVLALRVGRHSLPSNVKIIPLRPSGGHSRMRVLWTIFFESFRRRRYYDVVFARGDAQYPALFGWLWHLLGKKVVLWYAHYTSRTPWLPVADIFTDTIVTSVPAACRYAYAIPIGQGVDARLFTSVHEHRSAVPRLLIYGRVSPAKRVPWLLEQVMQADPELVSHVTVYGRATHPEEGARVRALVDAHKMMWVERDVSYLEASRVYQDFDIYVNATSASLDKTIVEAMLSQLVVIASTAGYRELLPPELLWLSPSDDQFGAAVKRAARLSPEERQAIGRRLAELAADRHTQSHQIKALLGVFQAALQTV